MLLLYGNADKLDPKQFIPVARVAPSAGATLVVQFLIDDQPATSEMLRDVRQELEFMLEQVEPDPWRYAVYHCGTAANWYSSVHWAHVVPTERGTQTDR